MRTRNCKPETVSDERVNDAREGVRRLSRRASGIRIGSGLTNAASPLKNPYTRAAGGYMARGRGFAWVFAAFPLLLPATPAFAQTSAIAGVVRDTTGGVMPGVTVEASSPALIEKTRVAVTDGDGQYKIIDLRPGTYTVTFTLPGFNTVKREGIELTSGFTATVDAEMRVGAVEET